MQRHIEYIQRLCRERRERIMELNKTVAEMRPRLMPEGMEWPRFDDGEPVRIGDAFSYGDETFYVDSIQLLRREFHLWATNGKVVTGSNGERCAHPAPKVLDADGVEIHVGDSVWDNRNWDALIVRSIGDEGNTVACRYVDVDDDAIPVHGMWMPSTLTHRAPVLAADGKPLREGETVWGTKGGSYNLTSVYDGKVFARHVGGSFGAEVESAGGEGLYRLRADQLTHERPDSWERLEEDIDDGPCVYFGRKACVDCPGNGRDGCEGQKAKARDLVRRAKALAGRDA